MTHSKHTSGFSLVEVNLAIFVISMGMLTLFSLFPAGLRQVEDSHAATQEALFADYVLSALRAEARLVDAATWSDPAAFRAAVLPVLTNIDPNLNLSAVANAQIVRVGFGADDQYMRFRIQFGAPGGGRRSVRLWCKAQEFGPSGSDFYGDANTRGQASRFYTEFAYSGMP